MTLPDERYRAVRYTREFLRTLLDPKQTPKVPRAVRRCAGMCLRHFPWESDMAEARRRAKEVWGEDEKIAAKRKMMVRDDY